MPEEAQEAPVVEQDKPTTEEAPEETGQATEATESKPEPFSEKFDPAELPDELRGEYQKMRADYTRKTTELAEQRRETEQEQELLSALRSDDPEMQVAALRYLGYEVPEDDGEYEEQDPVQEMQARVEALEQERYQQMEAQEQQNYQAAEVNYVDGEFDALSEATGRTFTDKQVMAIAGQAFARRDADGRPDVRGAYEFLFSDFLSEEKKAWMDSKNAPQAPQGQRGDPAVDLSNDQERRAAMVKAIEEEAS